MDDKNTNVTKSHKVLLANRKSGAFSGVVGEWAIRDTTFEMPSGVPMKLTSSEATNTYRNNAFFVEQSYGIPF